MSEPTQIFLRGKEYRADGLDESPTFEKRAAGSAGEILDVRGGCAGPGTGGDKYYRLWETGDIPQGIFLDQESHNPYVSGKPSSHHCEDGQPCDVAVAGVFLFNLRLITGQTIVKGDDLEPVTATPTWQKQSAGPVAARSAETITTTAETWIRAWNLVNLV